MPSIMSSCCSSFIVLKRGCVCSRSAIDCVCVCVCVYRRERERERESKPCVITNVSENIPVL